MFTNKKAAEKLRDNNILHDLGIDESLATPRQVSKARNGRGLLAIGLYLKSKDPKKEKHVKRALEVLECKLPHPTRHNREGMRGQHAWYKNLTD